MPADLPATLFTTLALLLPGVASGAIVGFSLGLVGGGGSILAVPLMVYVVGVPVCYVDNEWAPRGFVTPNVNNWLLGDVSSVILQSYIPYHQRIVDCPQIPEMKLCPSAANSLNSLFWMFGTFNLLFWAIYRTDLNIPALFIIFF